MSGNGKSKEGVTVVPFVKFISIPADSLCALHQSAKCRVSLAVVNIVARVITTIMPADGVDTLPNMINIVAERHRMWWQRGNWWGVCFPGPVHFYPGPILLQANSLPCFPPFLLMTVPSSITICYWSITTITAQPMHHHSLGHFLTAESILPMVIVLTCWTSSLCLPFSLGSISCLMTSLLDHSPLLLTTPLAFAADIHSFTVSSFYLSYCSPTHYFSVALVVGWFPCLQESC